MKIINTTNNTSPVEVLGTEIKCTKASIYYIDNEPFIDWYGITHTSNRYVIEVHIPKMSLNIQKLELDAEREYCPYAPYIIKSKQIFVKDGFKSDEDIIFTIREREMTKEQIEKELGYKVKIKE